MSTSENVRRPFRRRHTLIATAVVGVLVAVALLTLGVASGRPVAQHRSGDASAAKSAMSSTHQLSRAQGHAAQISRATSGHAAHSSSSGSGSTSSLSNSSIFSSLAPNRSLAATGCGIDGTNFEDADGNLTPATCLDWNSFAPVTWLPANAAPYQDATTTNGAFTFFGATDAVNDSTDTSYAGGQKQAFDCPLTGTGSVDNKTDLARIYVAETTAADGHQILYLAWVRGPLNNTSSDVHVGFEFNQGSDLCPVQTSAPFVHRTDGDILLVYNFTQGGTPTLAFATWQNGAWTTETTLDPLVAEAAIWNGTGSTSDLLKPSGAPDPNKQEFGEGGVDLTAALAELGTGTKDCAKFGHVFGESRTSGSSTSAQMKDLVGAKIDISTCVEPTVTTTLKNATTNNTIDNNSHVDLGTSVYDTAIFGNLVTGKTPTGTVQYTFFTNGACTGTGTDAGLKTVDGAGNIPQSNTEGPLAPGSYSFEAQYLSDDDPNYVDSEVSGCEPFTVDKADSSTATTIHDANHNPITSAALGSIVHDSAAVTDSAPGFDPTGNVSFTFFTSADCSTGGSGAGTVALASGVAHPSSPEGPLAAGSYSFQATYAGNSNFNQSTSDCEPLTINKADSSTATTIHDANHNPITSAALGSIVHDSAAVTDSAPGFDPTGNVSFTFFTSADCSTGGSGAGTVALASGVAHPSSPEGPLAAGSYSFQATYAGNSNFNQSTSDCEPLTINKADSSTATTIHDANHNPITSAALGSIVHDSAAVTDSAPGFDPTGNVSFTFFTSADCSTGGSGAGTVALASGVAHPSSPEGPLAAGSYSFQATYAGNSNFNQSTSDCEPLTINKADSSTATTIHDANHNPITSAALGSIVHDSAAVTDSAPGFDPTGNVSFTFFTSADCSTGGSGAGTVALASGVAHPSSPEGPLAAGSYSFQATYAGNSNFNQSTSDCEPLTINKADSSTATTIHDANHNPITSAALGSIVHDSAAVTDSAPGFDPTGNVSFTFFTSADCSTGGSGAGTVALASGVAHPSSPEGPLAAGSYSFQATYAGNSNFNQSTSDCEPLTINKADSSTATTIHDANHNPITSAALGSIVHDSAAVTDSAPGFDPTGNVSFTFFTSADCSTGGSGAGTVALASGVAHPSSPEGPLAAGSYSFQATYAGNSNFNQSTSDCEPLTINKADSSTATTIHDANHNPITSAALGSIVHDSAAVTDSAPGFDPTGNVSFTFFTSADCSTGGSGAGTVALASGVAHPSSPEGPLAAGSYSFQATYAGNSNFNQSTSDCEPLTINKASSTTDTVVFDAATNKAWTGAEQTGASAYDTATVTAGPFVPTGTVDYTFFTNGDCSGEGTSAGSVSLDQQGNVPNSDPTGPLGAGTYAFQATYSGDDNYTGSTGPCEPFSLGVPQTQTDTVVKDHDGAVVDADNPAALGSKVHDTATVSGQVGQIVPTGTVTYHLFSGLECNVDNEIGSGETVALNGDGSVPNSSETDPLQAGSYSYQAVYSGDSNYATSTGPCEPFKVAQADSSTDTVVKDHDGAVVDADNPAALGSQVHDTATVTASPFTATGNLTYHLFSGLECNVDNEIGSGETVALNGDGSVPNSSETDPLQAGSYSYKAVYEGDSNYNGSTGPCEPFKIAQADSSTDTVVKDSNGAVVDADNPAALGSQVHDTATVTASPFTATGNLTYHLFSGLECNVDNEIGSGETVALNGDGSVPNSSETDPLQAGSYSYQAVYQGDSNYNGSTGPCEPFKIAQADSSTDTVVKDHDGAVVDADNPAALGSQVHDTATVTASPFTATGNLTYHLFSGLECNVDNEIGSGETVALNGDGSVPNSSETDPLQAGSYSYQAVYEGDSNYNGSTGPCEPFKIAKAQLTPSTTIKNAADNSTVDSALPLGSKVFDTTQLSGAVEGFDPTGTVSYRFFQNGNCSGEGSSAGSDVALDGQSDTTPPLGAGDYSFQATYSGDSNYDGATSPCEPLTIGNVTPSASTTLKNAATNATIENGSTLPNGSSVYDTADISNAGGFPLTGTVSFRFFHNGDCSGTPASVQTGVAVGGHSAATGALDEGSYGFQAMYVAGDDPNHANSDWSACEPFNVQGLVDLAVTKSGSPATQQLGAGNITWTIVVTNNGPDADTGVKITDPMPAGNTFVSATASKGTCTGGAILNCTIGDMAVGEQVTITLVTTPSATGTQTNVVGVSGDKPESNTGNNQATASVEITGAPFVLPCVAVSKVTPKQLFVGRKTKLTIHVTQDKKAVKGIHVRIKGPKTNIKTGASNSKGVIKQTLKMKKAGVLVFTPIASKRCNTKRVGVTNVFTPPVTG